MKGDPLLNKAAQLAKRREYESALKILKDEEDRYNGSFKYYYLYAVICLHSGSFVEALEFFRYARQIKGKDTKTLLGLAVLYLKRMNTAQALDFYLDAQEMEPKNKIAKKALSVIKANSASEALSEWMTPKRITKLYPPIPAPILSSKNVVNIVLIFIAAAAVSLTVLMLTDVITNPFKKEQRPTADFLLTSDERNFPVETGGVYRYILTRDQAVNLYERALSFFTSYRDEAAKVNLNRILESNASEGLKDRAILLLENMETPGFDNFNRQDNPSLTLVNSEPVLYRNVHVIWTGMATNVEITDEYTRFDFLVGYDTRRVLEGIVPVIFYSPVSISIEHPLEVLGRVVLTSQPDIRLEGIAIHQSRRLEN